MNQVTAIVTLDQDAGTIKLALDLQGDSPLDHEILAAAIGSGRDVHIAPMHQGDELFADIIITDQLIWPRAVRALTNRMRVASNQPTLEEENYNRVAAGLPTVEDEALDQAEQAHEAENNRRISAGLPTLEDEEDNRYHAAMDSENVKRAASGLPQLTREDFDRAKADRVAKRDASLKAEHDVAVEANASFKERRDKANSASHPLFGSNKRGESAARTDDQGADVRPNALFSPAANNLAEKTAGEDLISDAATRSDPRPQSLKEVKDRIVGAKS